MRQTGAGVQDDRTLPLKNAKQRQSCKAFIGLTIRAKMIGGGRPLLRENLADTEPPPCKKPIFNHFRS